MLGCVEREFLVAQKHTHMHAVNFVRSAESLVFAWARKGMGTLFLDLPWLRRLAMTVS